jgi:TPR repeat protein
MKLASLSLWGLALAFGAACGRADSGPRAAAPRAAPGTGAPAVGTPQQEVVVLAREFPSTESGCNRTAEEVVAMHRRCSETRWPDCVYAASMYATGCGVAEDRARAQALYEQSCRFGSSAGCLMGAAIAPDVERRITLLELPCARGDTYSCGALGAQLVDRGRQADVARAADFIEKACRAEQPSFCSDLGALVIKWRLEPRFGITRLLLDRACKANDPESCHVLARALDDGAFGFVDGPWAASRMSIACHELSHLPSCQALGHMFVLGRSVKKDLATAAHYFDEACKRYHAPSCDSMGEALEKGWFGPPEPAKALSFYGRGCQLDDAHACRRAQELRATGIEKPAGD